MVPSSITRSKPSNIQSVTTPITRSKSERIQGLTAPTRSRSIGSIQPTASTIKPSRGFFSRNNSEGVSRSRPPVEAINGSTPRSQTPINSITTPTKRQRPSVEAISGVINRSKPSVTETNNSQRSGVNRVTPTSGSSPLSSIGGGAIVRGKSRPGPLKVSDL